MADFQELCGSGTVSSRLHQRASNQNFLDRGGGLLDGKLSRRELHVHRIEGFAESLREIDDTDDVAVAEDHGAFDGVFELAHVARPSIFEQELAGVRGNRADVRPQPRVRSRDEVIDEKVDVFFSGAEGRDGNGRTLMR